MNLILIPSLLLFLTGLSSETASLVDSVDELVISINEDELIGARSFHVTNPCMPPVGFTTGELLVYIYHEGRSDDLREIMRYMECTYSYDGYLIISTSFYNEDDQLAFCHSIWTTRNSGVLLHEDFFYFQNGETIACGYGDEDIHEPSEEDLQRGASRMDHSEYLIEFYINARIPAPPVFTEQFDLIY